MVLKKTMSFLLLLMPTLACSSCQNPSDTADTATTRKTHISIILGSTRQGRSSDKIAQELKHMLGKRPEVVVAVLDLRDFNLPFLDDEVAPASRKTITDARVQKWSDAVSKSDAFIIVVPEYNAGYPGVLKNALDSLYHEWNGKPVAFVGYSGGSAGGSHAIEHLCDVVQALNMIPLEDTITIPNAWKAFDSRGKLQNQTIEPSLHGMVDQLIAHRTKK